MTVEKIHYEELFPTGIYANQRLRAEVRLDGNDTVEESFQYAKTLVQQAFHSINPNFEEQKGTVITPVIEPVIRSREDEVAAHLITIGECKTLRNLQMFANMVQRVNDDRLYEAYHNKKKQLQ